jgi:hypothetical protein
MQGIRALSSPGFLRKNKANCLSEWLPSIFYGLALMKKAIRYVRSAIEDLAFPNRSSRESDQVGRRGCIEHDFAKGQRSGRAREQRIEFQQ